MTNILFKNIKWKMSKNERDFLYRKVAVARLKSLYLLISAVSVNPDKPTLVYQINVPGRLFFFEKKFQPGCFIRYTPFIKFMEIFPDRMPISYTPFIIFERFF